MNDDTSRDGSVFGQYFLRDQIGTGGMGAVYLAEQPALKRRVAIKVLHSVTSNDPHYSDRFAREAQMAAALEHPHIVPIYDHGTTPEGVSYVVMRLLNGGTLGQRLEQMLKREEQPALFECAKLLRQMASALDYAHNRGLIHRDIKPNNIMFDDQGNAYLVDFGIARMSNQNSATTLTQTGTMVGTPVYMPPELWRGEDWQIASDQYSLAVVMYEMIAGRSPFEAKTLYQLINQHLNDVPEPISDFRADVPASLIPVMERALSKDPTERYPNMMAFADAFEAAIRDATQTNLHSTSLFTMPIELPSSLKGTPQLTPRITPQRPLVVTPAPAAPDAPPAPSVPRKRLNLALAVAGVAFLGLLVVVGLLLNANTQRDNLQATLIALEATQAANPDLLSADQQTATAVACAATLPAGAAGLTGQIAFESRRSGASNLYLMNADGTGVVRLTDSTSDDTHPIWSPDGLTLAFLSTRSGAEDIYLLSATAAAPDTFELRRLTENTVEDGDPTWSPDGKQLTFASQTDGNWDIYSINADGSNLRRLTDDSAPDTEPQWSPDGTRIAFASERDGSGAIYVMNANGSNLRRLTNSQDKEGESLAWSPDGTRIAYVAIKPDGNWEVRVIGLEAGAQPQDFAHRTADEWQPQWSPDGLLGYLLQTDNVEILAARGDGSNLRNITSASSDDWSFSWSPDGVHIAFETDRSGDWEIYGSDVCGGDVRRLTNNSADDNFPAWRPVLAGAG